MRRTILLGAAIVVAAGCRAIEDDRGPDPEPKSARARRAKSSSAHDAASEAAAAEAALASAAGAAAAAASRPEAEPRAATAEELAYLSDPAFRRRLAESWLSESDVEPRLAPPEREALTRALELVAADRGEEAAAALEAARTPGASAAVDFALGNLRLQRDECGLARPAFEAATAKFPKFRRAWRNLGVVCVRLGDHDGARAALTKVVELGGGDATTYGLLGFACSGSGRFGAAETAYRMATLLDPGTLEWRLGLARSFFKQRRFDDAAALAGELIADHPERADLWLLQANAFLGLGQPMKAAENFEVVDRLGKADAESLGVLGDVYVNQELYDLAADAYVKALDREGPAGVPRTLRSAKALVARGAGAEARRVVERVAVVGGDGLAPEARKDVLRIRARVASADGASEEEARLLEEIVALDPLDGEALVLLGKHRARVGDPERAIFCFERAASLEAFEAEAKVRHAQVLVGQGRYAEALPLLRRAQTVRPREDVGRYLEQVERAGASK